MAAIKGGGNMNIEIGSGQLGGFVSGTPIWTDKGLVPIELLRPGDRVLVGFTDDQKPIYEIIVSAVSLHDHSLFCVRWCDVNDQDRTYNLYCSRFAEIWGDDVGFRASYRMEGGEMQRLASHRNGGVLESVPIWMTSRPDIGWEPEYGHSVVGWYVDFSGGAPVIGDGFAMARRESLELFKGIVHAIRVESPVGFFALELGLRVR